MLTKVARFSFRHRWLVLLFWAGLLLGITAWSRSLGSAFSTSFKLPDSDSQKAVDLLESRFPAQLGATGDLVFKAESGVRDPAVQDEVSGLIDRISRDPNVVAVKSPYSPEGANQISPDGQIAYAVIQFDLSEQELSHDKSTVAGVKDIVADAQGGALQYELGGNMFEAEPSIGAEGVGIVAAIIILLVAFGSVLAMALPIITALFGVGIGIGAITLLSHTISMMGETRQLAAMIGIGVGIDYALFIVTRYRKGLHDNLSPEQANFQAVNTAGRAVVFAGFIVVVSLLGMVLINIEFVQGMGIGAATVVAITMLAAVTLLPAVISFVGSSIDRLRIPGIGNHAHKEDRGFFYRWSRFVERHPWSVLLVGLVIIITLALPMFSMRLGSSDASARPESDTTRRAYDLLSEGFGLGFNGPLMLAAGIDGQADLAVLGQVRQQVMADENVAFVSPPVPNEDFSAAVMQVIPRTSPQDEGTLELMNRLRSETLPAATAGSDVEVHVGGITAAFDDIAQVLEQRLPLFIAAVLAFSFILLTIVFRSLIIPIKAVILNMLSIGAAYGVLVVVFQWGFGGSLLGLGSTGPIESFLPMMLFAILFGLSMDYEVFLLSSIKEEYDRTGDNSQAISLGLIRTARVITAAAAIMVCVFGSFILGENRIIKEFGFGLAVAILIDSTIVRMLLVPSAMHIMGKLNWWLPGWLRWMPAVHIDGNEVITSDVED